LDVALVQTTPPDKNGDMSLGISVDIVKEAVEKASLVIVQANSRMPRVYGDCMVNIDDVDFVIPYDEPLLEYHSSASSHLSQPIGQYVARIVEDGSTIQVGYGSIPDAILAHLADKKHLGVHTELLSDGLVDLIKMGVVDNTEKSLDRGKSVATFCMGRRATYEYLHENPAVEFRPIDYTNNPLVIAKQRYMTAINSALAIDLTGQASAESLGESFYSGVGGQVDFMRGAVLAPGGRTILALPSVAQGGAVSRIVPSLDRGATITLTRGDIHYVVTEYGIAYLHGKTIRERAMELISIAHPRFRPWLIEEAKRRSLIYKDQAYVPGEGGIYPAYLETRRTTKTGLPIFLRPVKISDEPLLKDFFYSLSQESIYRRFLSARREMPHRMLQELSVVDYNQTMVILAVFEAKETLLGVGQYSLNQGVHTADIALVVGDQYQNQGVGMELLSYLTQLAKRQGLLGFTAEVLAENEPVFRLFQKMGFHVEKRNDFGIYEMKVTFRENLAS
jgi:ribosomal protein S18 acetylase RimI-like enzyme